MKSGVYRRSRGWLVFGIVLVIAAGLASRKFPMLLPAFLGAYPGDALWVLMVLLMVACVKPAMAPPKLAAAALAISFLVEASQLYQEPWINAIRATTLGHLVLGTGFQWLDLFAYAVRVAFGLAGDYAFSRRYTAAVATTGTIDQHPNQETT